VVFVTHNIRSYHICSNGICISNSVAALKEPSETLPINKEAYKQKTSPPIIYFIRKQDIKCTKVLIEILSKTR